jgi:hypothetical protein
MPMSVSGVLSAEVHAGERASDAVVLKRWTRLVRLRAASDLTGPRLSSDGCAASVATNASIGWKSIVRNLTMQDTWRASERRTLDAASVAMATDASVALEKRPVNGQRLYSFMGL